MDDDNDDDDDEDDDNDDEDDDDVNGWSWMMMVDDEGEEEDGNGFMGAELNSEASGHIKRLRITLLTPLFHTPPDPELWVPLGRLKENWPSGTVICITVGIDFKHWRNKSETYDLEILDYGSILANVVAKPVLLSIVLIDFCWEKEVVVVVVGGGGWSDSGSRVSDCGDSEDGSGDGSGNVGGSGDANGIVAIVL
ncbi:hypothetical protein PoB_005733300 [Plakobranchus ocellatus]|uniref:Uncharacterized protein n=1 Tax=Plakobranchus ocellatus TaxID=259542 RepID=A0AAV4CGZ8_9GAST|nr:hypothetical protein PoB_005733300 [Plakobranchus ocellatus]